MLTISQLAAYAGVTVRAVRHYHAKGLLAEPPRDHSGYRRYAPAAVVELIKIRTLAEAGVPLSRVRELLSAGDEEFAAAITEIDLRLRAEIRDRQRHRERIARLAAGDSLALPPEAVAYLDRMREFGFRERLVQVERDSWILLAAQMPDEVPAFMAIKQSQLDNEELRRFYLDIGDLVDCPPDDPRLSALADRVVAFIEVAVAAAETQDWPDEHPISDDLVELLLETHNHPEDRVLVIGQYIKQLRRIAERFDVPIITGSTTNSEREDLYGRFRAGVFGA
ncbi:MAG: MerR family DNA-binding transcriptional regulator, partial [Actinobacteria bacterium]|nr:MerR family DNA-binding transcriptional regulator [Actinomycetota bacterium]